MTGSKVCPHAPLLLCCALGATLAACGGDDDESAPPAPLEFCEGATELIYDPPSGALDAFPDDYFTAEDESTPTGLRVNVVMGDNVAAPATGSSFASVFDALSTLDGFGTTAAITLSFTGPIDESSLPPSGEGSGSADASVLLVDLDAEETTFLDFEWELVAENPGEAMTTLIVSPLAPLRPMQRYALVVTNAARDAGGECIAPSPVMRELVEHTGSAPELVRLGGRYRDLVGQLTEASSISTGGEITAALIFTTQHTVDDSVVIAKKIRDAGAPAYTARDTCTDTGEGYAICEGEFPAKDFRKEQRFIDPDDLTPQASYTLPVTTYLPTSGSGPFPTLIFGHGLSGERHQAEALAKVAAREGFATVAIDASRHGEHPDTAGGAAGLGSVFEFFALDATNMADPLDALTLRDNWRQSTYDKLQLLELLRPGLDVDADGTDDIGIGQLGYHGVSLGGIMGAEFLALAPEVEAGITAVPGARVVNIIKDSQQFAVVITLMRAQATDGQVARFFPIVQTVVDRGDAGAYTRHVVRERLPDFDAATPQLLMQLVLNDDTVPNSTNKFYARGLDVPHLGDELLPIGGIPHEPALPISGNIDDTHSAGVFEFDVVQEGTGTAPATHSNVHDNPVGIEQSLHFMRTYFDTGTSEIIDPYRTLGVKP